MNAVLSGNIFNSFDKYANKKNEGESEKNVTATFDKS
jgi:hypothetical protein